MIDPEETIFSKLWFFVVVLLIATNLVLLSLHLSSINALGLGSSEPLSGVNHISGSSKVFVGRVATGAGRAGHAVSITATQTLNGGIRFVFAMDAHGSRTLGSFTDNDATLISRTMVGGLSAAAYGSVHVVGVISSAATVSSFMKPADRERAPTIVPIASVLPIHSIGSAVSAPVGEAPQWPIHGTITTLFGASDLPYQRVHTGLDISDGRPAGATPVLPFRSGQVAEVIHSGGLGNHIVVDHGGGVTSVYGHLSSTLVQVGQQVNEGTVLGREGSTGASTGTHLHFEIRSNGQPIDPSKFIGGHP